MIGVSFIFRRLKSIKVTLPCNFESFHFCQGLKICANDTKIRWMSNGRTVRIGCASGFWGDTAVAGSQLIHTGNLDFLVFDYLSEITMSLLTAAKQKQSSMGYAPDFVQVGIGPFLKTIKQKGPPTITRMTKKWAYLNSKLNHGLIFSCRPRHHLENGFSLNIIADDGRPLSHTGIRVVSNAGGINPHGCASAIQQAAKKSGVDLKVAVVTGDDILSLKSQLDSNRVVDMHSGKSLPTTITSMTAYLGAAGIHKSLDFGADIVVTGRCTDSALALGPLIHTYGWSYDNYNLMAAGSLAGHLIECGAQATGGIFTDWQTVSGWENIGFPIVECSSDGQFILTKPPNTGGLVTPGTVSEQLVYEIGDPANYLLPDVACDFTDVKIEPFSRYGEAVRVSGARGNAPSNEYKVSATYADGYRLTAVCVVIGTKATEKGRKTAGAIIARVQGIFKAIGLEDFADVHIEIIGAEDSYGAHAKQANMSRECVVWIAAHHKDKKALEILSREIAPAGTGMAPGLCGIVGGRPKVSPVLRLFSFMYPKDRVKVNVELDNKQYSVDVKSNNEAHWPGSKPHQSDSKLSGNIKAGSHTFRLEELAFARSGDKGNTSNIGVIARHPSIVPYIRQQLTSEAVEKYMAHVFENDQPVQKKVIRYELPGINGFNFLLHNALGGGGIASLRSDPQGKAFAQMLLDFEIKNVPNLLLALTTTQQPQQHR